jgi:hypothetical protein
MIAPGKTSGPLSSAASSKISSALTGGGSGTTPPAFTPSDIAGLRLWLKADDAATVINTAGAVDEWRDKSGNSYHATATTTLRPTTGTRTLNGKNVLDFDGTTDWMILPSGLYAVPAGPNTLFSVYVSDNTGDATQELICGATAGNAIRYCTAFTATTFTVINRTTSLALTSMADVRDTNPRASGLIRSGVNITPFVNGVKGTAGTNAEDFTCASLFIGAQPNTGTNRFNGVMAEHIWYNSALSDADCNRVGAYLATEWGATWTAM